VAAAGVAIRLKPKAKATMRFIVKTSRGIPACSF
jgi:hypothetical protein